MLLADIRRAIEAALENLTPARAQELAKSFLGPGAAKEQVAKTASELLEWSNRSREKMREFIDHEVGRQMKVVGVATEKELDALKKRVRELERETGTGTTAGKRTAASKSGAKKTTRRKPAAKTTAAKPSA